MTDNVNIRRGFGRRFRRRPKPLPALQPKNLVIPIPDNRERNLQITHPTSEIDLMLTTPAHRLFSCVDIEQIKPDPLIILNWLIRFKTRRNTVAINLFTQKRLPF
jgi:hypothetical protein